MRAFYTVSAHHKTGPRRRALRARIWLLLATMLTSSPVLISGVAAQSRESGLFLAEPTAYTDVLDALDGDDPLDFRLTIGFQTVSQDGLIRQEQRGTGGLLPQLVDFAETNRTQKRMWMVADVGLLPDLMLTVRAPFVLEDARTMAPTPLALQSGLLDTSEGATYGSRVRDGVPYVALGLSYGVLNQYRTPGLPTVTLRVSTQIATGEAKVPCMLGDTCFRGAGRGTVRLAGEGRMSYRYRYVEPFVGVRYSAEVVTTGSDYYFPQGDASGDLDRQPPRRFGFTLGAAFIPWENRGRYQRLSLDARFSATHVDRGRDYSPLFDLLGTSAALRDTTEGGADFRGLTTVDAHARFEGSLAVRVQAAQYVRFELSAAFSALTAHLLTGAYPCAAGGEAVEACSGKTLNPSYIPAIDRPGHRFQLTDAYGLTLSASAAAQF